MPDFFTLQIYVLQDTELMKFVFDRDPTSAQKKVDQLKHDLEEEFKVLFLLLNS